MTTEGNTQVGEATIHWRHTGSGPAIVFVHGFPLCGRSWDPVIARLSDRFSCFTPDVIGLGESHSPIEADHSSQCQALALQKTLKELGVSSYALVGNDSGGWIARELALIDAPRVTRLILTNTEIPGHRPPWIPLYQTLARVPGCGRAFRLLLRSRRFRRSTLGFGNCFHDMDHLDGEFHQRTITPLLSKPGRIEGAMAFLRNMDFRRLDAFRSLHRRLTMPTLFIWGRDDRIFPETRARDMLSQFPDIAGFHSIADARLFFYEEQPLVVAKLIAEFLD